MDHSAYMGSEKHKYPVPIYFFQRRTGKPPIDAHAMAFIERPKHDSLRGELWPAREYGK